MEWIKEGKPEDNKMIVAICKASPIPFICIYQNGEPTQVVSSFSAKTVTHKFKDVKHEIIAFQYLESGDIRK